MTAGTGETPSRPTPETLGGHRFRDAGLLREALTHRCALRRHPDGTSLDSERLEFLGDAVLGLALADVLHERRPQAREGELSACRAALVSRASLARASRALGLPGLIDAGDDTPAAERIRATDSAAENAFEAVVGAVYRDAGPDAARSFILRALGDTVDTVAPVDSPKNRLQEWLQARHPGVNATSLVEYRTVSAEGPDHARRYTVEVRFDGARQGLGTGGSVKIAGEAAARAALERQGSGETAG